MATRAGPIHGATSTTDRDLQLWLAKHHYSLDTGWSWVILTGSCLAQVIISLIYVVGIFNVIFLEVFQDDRQTTAWLGAVQSSFLSLFGECFPLVANAAIRYVFIIYIYAFCFCSVTVAL